MVARHLGVATGVAQLGAELGLHVVDAVHEMHGRIASFSLPFGAAQVSARPVYAAVRAGFHLAHASFGTVGRLLPTADRTEEAGLLQLRSVVNGVFGHRLAQTGNPLALPMTLHRADEERPSGDAPALLFLHGLCANETIWQRGAHPGFVGSAKAAGFDVAYLRYNSGSRISQNGAALSQLLERGADTGPLWLIGHSMGGLVARSALHQALATGMRWPDRVRALVTLGAPHDGAALERIGNHANRLLRLLPYTAPLSRLGNLRSDGIRDLRHGNLLETDWCGVRDPDHLHDPRQPQPLASGIRHVFVAATRSPTTSGPPARLANDKLVSVSSALALAHLGGADAERHVLPGLDHMGLLASRRVHALLEALLA